MHVSIKIDYETSTHQVRVERPKSIALTLEALGLVLQALGERDVRGIEREDGLIRVSSPLAGLPPGSGGPQ